MNAPTGKPLLLAAIIAPLSLFFLAGMLIDDSPRAVIDDVALTDTEQPDPDRHFILVATRVVLMTLAITVGWSLYARSFPLKIDRWALIVGIIGSILWIVICELRLESALLRTVGMSDEWLSSRSGVNPLELYGGWGRRWMFLALRFVLLAALVPVAEELFLRGFLMRAFDSEDWTRLPLQQVGTSGLVAGTLYGVLSHPGEFIAAAVWFSLVTFLMVKTGRFWNCVVAHAITNLVLGLYILNSGSWYLW